jgi:zinc D-Ala-D-Ala carboxypeptidase
MQLTKNFTLEELLLSQEAERKGYDEQYTPAQDVIDNLNALCANILQPYRERLRKGINISSGYRCLRVNSGIGGAPTSQHIKGQAADISVSGTSTETLYQNLKSSGLPFDQLIQEFDRWVHISYDPAKPNQRNECLRAVKNAQGQTQYVGD